jgi:alanyl-tRNA synthetase
MDARARRGGLESPPVTCAAKSLFAPMQPMTSAEIRRSFLEFFRSRQHTIVPSSSLLPDSPNLLFTNAGMNQFVPIFLSQRRPDVDQWPGAIPGLPTRAADTQKCIRAGGKHNDLEDVGLDTYHHTFFEMLGNWSFGDYFKREAIDWAWELVTEIWRFPRNRLYATVYSPDPSKGDPAEFDQEAWDIWAGHFRKAGLDPQTHIVRGGRKDNFWMMGETGPCGPCSEMHVDLTPAGDTGGVLVNRGTAECIEIWNLVFIQFNANPDGTYSPLPARHVDTGMGFERVTSIIQGTRGFTDFVNARVSNYETDVFRPLFAEIERLTTAGGHPQTYRSTLPPDGPRAAHEAQVQIDIAFRVIADHIRTLSFAVADGIHPGNSDRHYVLRRILRRAVRYGRSLGFKEPFFYQLVDVVVATMGEVFPEIHARQQHVKDLLRQEEVAFNRTLDKGIALFNDAASAGRISGAIAFRLYDEQGFPLDLTELMARERGIEVDTEGFHKLMEEQRARARAARKKEVIGVSQIDTTAPTRFVGYETFETAAQVLEVVRLKDKTAVILDTSACYPEMGGQIGDAGELSGAGKLWRISDTRKHGDTLLHLLETGDWQPEDAAADLDTPLPGQTVMLRVDASRRGAIQRHHTVTHLLHWALHEVAGPDAAQKGSYVGPDKLTFDFNSAPLTPRQIADVERLVNERIVENSGVSWTEVPYAEVKSRRDVMQFFGEKYGDRVRVVQIGGTPANLNGYSMELCGGTHVRATGELGLFRILGEGAIAAGVRRVEAVAGTPAYDSMRQERELIRSLAGKVNAPLHELDKKLDALIAHQKELEKALKAGQQREASNVASNLRSQSNTINGIPAIIHNVGGVNGDFLQAVADALKGGFKGVIVLGGAAEGTVALVASVSPEFTGRIHAGKLIQQIAPIIGGKGGGKPDNARGGGRDAGHLEEALAKARTLL